MGRPKGRLRHPSGRTLLGEAVHRLRPWTRIQVVAGRGGGETAPAALPRLADPPGLHGPLAGIARVAGAFPAAYYLVLAVDLPRARPGRLMSVGRRFPGRAVIGQGPEGGWQPLAGLYPAAQARQALWTLRHRGRRVMPWALAGRPVPVRGPWWVNVNSPEEARIHLGPDAVGETP
jgi:molybdopterin-guanine dinucleotide biosynthesis protein A